MNRVLSVLALFAASAHAAPAAVIETPGGTVVLHADATGCIEQARRAEWVSQDMKIRIPGCWVTDGRTVQVAFQDGDAQRYPVAFVKKPEGV